NLSGEGDKGPLIRGVCLIAQHLSRFKKKSPVSQSLSTSTGWLLKLVEGGLFCSNLLRARSPDLRVCDDGNLKITKLKAFESFGNELENV
ncbi:unnamed protein product, partial [Heterotrigona itama]